MTELRKNCMHFFTILYAILYSILQTEVYKIFEGKDRNFVIQNVSVGRLHFTQM